MVSQWGFCKRLALWLLFNDDCYYLWRKFRSTVSQKNQVPRWRASRRGNWKLVLACVYIEHFKAILYYHLLLWSAGVRWEKKENLEQFRRTGRKTKMKKKRNNKAVMCFNDFK